MTKCECGCGREIIWKSWHKYRNIRFIRGHSSKDRKVSEETKKKISISCKGLWSGENNPNYGKHLSEEHKNKISISCKGRKVSEETKKKISISCKGKNNPFYGKHHTKETKKIWSELRKGKNNSNYGKHHFHTEETKQKISDAIIGENHPNWKGGITNLPYCEKFNNELKEYIRNKYDRKCFNCNKDEKHNKRKLSVHHVDYDKDQGCNGKTFELIPLCLSCHSKTNYNREYWRNRFIEKLEKI